ncbi:MAG: FtsQ-type POTRA domain-containing protein [Peptostreptococcaceae bacterium]|nr:FtsQ-type POTRA domain-containing protein [Peptostreptococcaceae bacterium]
MKRKNTFKIAIAIAVFIVAIYTIVFMTNIFIVENCSIMPKIATVYDDALSESILGQNIFILNAEEVMTMLEENPEVKSVTLRRHFPDSIEIDVILREKIIQVEYMNGTIGIAADGYVMDYEPFPEEGLSGDYLRVKGFEFERFARNSVIVTDKYEVLENIIMLAKFLKNDIEEKTDFVFIEDNHLILQIQKDFLVDFGLLDDPIEDKLEKMKLILQDLSSKNINRGIINMRYEKNPVYYPIY